MDKRRWQIMKSRRDALYKNKRNKRRKNLTDHKKATSMETRLAEPKPLPIEEVKVEDSSFTRQALKWIRRSK